MPASTRTDQRLAQPRPPAAHPCEAPGHRGSATNTQLGHAATDVVRRVWPCGYHVGVAATACTRWLCHSDCPAEAPRCRPCSLPHPAGSGGQAPQHCGGDGSSGAEPSTRLRPPGGKDFAKSRRRICAVPQQWDYVVGPIRSWSAASSGGPAGPGPGRGRLFGQRCVSSTGRRSRGGRSACQATWTDDHGDRRHPCH